ncbi:MAG TPA: ATP-binding protein [Dehalococcoidia bacterium]|nr:ATP-binding protein [Dehalococcoidia bacterium]
MSLTFVFIDREAELAELRRLADRGQPALVLLYGRRRVGKTYLLEHAWEGRRVFYFLAADATAALNRSELLRELSAWTGEAYPAADYPTWRTVFRAIAQLADAGPIVVVLDEFQYLMGQEDDVVSQLVAVWDREVRDRPLLLVLCGSEVGTLEGLQHGGQPLYGRPAWSARLRPFDYFDAARMAPNRPLREAAYLYGILGGTPRYLAAIEPAEPLAEAIARTVLSPRGEVYLQLSTIVEQERGVRSPAEYRAVLVAIAGGARTVNEIAQTAGLQERPYTARHALDTLESLGLVRRDAIMDAREKAPIRYLLDDNAVGFWYRFVSPNRSRLETGPAGPVWDAAVAPRLDDYMGRIFEQIVTEAFRRFHQRWGLPAAQRWARWEGVDRNRRSIEVDLIAELDDGSYLAGEVKWSSAPVGSDVHYLLERNLDDLARSGQRWAHAALDGPRLYASAAGFTLGFYELAAQHPDIHLRTLDDLYPNH